MNVEQSQVVKLPLAARPWRWQWGALLALICLLVAVSILAERSGLQPGLAIDRLVSYKITSYANLLLFAASLLYVAHLRFSAVLIGKWATGLATAGAIGLATAFFLRWYETYQILAEGHVPLTNLYEVTVFFTALTVIVYLMMEQWHQVKTGGAFVMPLVLTAIAFQIWLAASGQAGLENLVPALKSYWLHAHVLANFIAYGAFAVAAGTAVMYLLRARAERFTPVTTRLPTLEVCESLIYRSINIGFPLFTLATILGAAWAYNAWGGYWSWDPKETWSLIVWLIYAAFLHLRYVKGWSGSRMAWWAVLGFAATLFCFVGVNLFLSGLHSYGHIQ